MIAQECMLLDNPEPEEVKKLDNAGVANMVFDMVNKSYTYKNKVIRTIVINEDVWFCGKDVANILGYSDLDKAVRMHVRDRNKNKLRDLIENMSAKLAGIQNYNNRDLAMIYVNEPGLYSLIMRSKLKLAEQFQDWITDEVLPSIRKLGHDKYLEQLSQQQQELEDRQKKLERAESMNLKLIQSIKSEQIDRVNGHIYVATNEQYALNNHFRIGRTTSLKARLAQYKTGRTKNDRLYYAFTCEVAQVNVLEKVIHTLLEKFKEEPSIDMYVLPWPVLEKFMHSICSTWNSNIITPKNDLVLENIAYDGPVVVPPQLQLFQENLLTLDEPAPADEHEETNEEDNPEEKDDEPLDKRTIYGNEFVKWFTSEYVKSDDENIYIKMKDVFSEYKKSASYLVAPPRDRKSICTRKFIEEKIADMGMSIVKRTKKKNITLSSIVFGYYKL